MLCPLPALLPELQPNEDSEMPALDLEDEDFTPPEPAPSPYLVPLAELAKPAAPMPDAAAQKLAEAARRREWGTNPAARLKAIRDALGDLRGGADVDPAELAAPLQIWRELHEAALTGGRLESELALLASMALIQAEIEETKERKAASRKAKKAGWRPASRKAKPSARKPVTAPALPQTHPEEEIMIDLTDPVVRLDVIRRACREINAGILADPIKRADCIKPWPAFYRLATERQDIDLAEIYGTCAAQLERHIAGKSRQTDSKFHLRPPARKAASRPAPSAPDYGDVI